MGSGERSRLEFWRVAVGGGGAGRLLPALIGWRGPGASSQPRPSPAFSFPPRRIQMQNAESLTRAG